MKITLIGIALSLSLVLTGQQMSWDDWESQARTDIRMLPEYGHVEKTREQKESDKAFVETVMKRDSSLRKGSDHLVELGFSYLYRDVKTAMYRFNQAYLLDPTNAAVYWGYGAVYLTLGNLEKAREQYERGLAITPTNTHLLTDYGTYFMAQYYRLEAVDHRKAAGQLDSAAVYLAKSYDLHPQDQNTAFKLSVLHWHKGDCESAWKYYDQCKAYGGQPITDAYTKELTRTCKRKIR